MTHEQVEQPALVPGTQQRGQATSGALDALGQVGEGGWTATKQILTSLRSGAFCDWPGAVTLMQIYHIPRPMTWKLLTKSHGGIPVTVTCLGGSNRLAAGSIPSAP